MVIDTETTGLDARKARIVEIAAVRVANGRLDMGDAIRRLVRPAKAVPKQTTGVRGIDDAVVAAALPFADVWPELCHVIDGKVVIGHSVGFDLAVLERECARARIPWKPPRTLDVRLLAEVAVPDLPEYSLETLPPGWGLRWSIGIRHCAMQ